MKTQKIFSSFPVSRELSNNSPADFKLVGFGIKHCRSGIEQIIPNIYNSGIHYSLIFNHEAVRVNIDGEDTELPPDTLILWDNISCKAKYGETGKKWHLSWLQFSGNSCEHAMKEHDIQLNTPVFFNNERIIRTYWEPFYEELNTQSRPDSSLLVHFITGIFLELKRLMFPSDHKAALIPESFVVLKQYIEEHYLGNLSLTQLASRIHLAPAYLSRKFKEYFGVSPLNYVILLRLNNAALCLRNHQLSIKEVAELSGYSDSLYFSRIFKRYMGKSPEMYRKKLHFEQN